MGRKLAFASVAVTLGLLAGPAAAQAADTYVDKDRPGADDIGCESIADACLTVQGGVIAAGPGDTVFVDGSGAMPTESPYVENVVLGSGKSLIGRDFGTDETDPIIAGTDPFPAVTVSSGDNADQIGALTLRGDTGAAPGGTGLLLQGIATVISNTFDGDASFPESQLQVVNTGNTSLITGNIFETDSAPLTDQPGIVIEGASPQVIGNYFTGLPLGIHMADSSSASISSNRIEATASSGFGVIVGDGSTPTLVGNVLRSPANPATTTGVQVEDSTLATTATLRRNTIQGYAFGVRGVLAGTGGVTVDLDSDLITGSMSHGLVGSDGASPGVNLNATNVTLAGNGVDIQLQESSLVLDSSIVEDAIGLSGTSSCMISFSRGPSMGAGCSNFQTTLPAGLTGDFHLAPGSAMIDIGNPAAPAPTSLDIDGDARALSSAPGCLLSPGTRDIGADEFVPATGIGCPVASAPPPTSSPTPATAATAAKKKCKKGRKLKRGKCVKKKKR